jgi:hypothetical protein
MKEISKKERKRGKESSYGLMGLDMKENSARTI